MTKSVIVRVDVDTPTDSLLLNKLRFKKSYLRYLFGVFDLSMEYGVKMSFMFRVPFNVEKYLEYRYGSDWKIPIKKWKYKDDGAMSAEIRLCDFNARGKVCHKEARIYKQLLVWQW